MQAQWLNPRLMTLANVTLFRPILFQNLQPATELVYHLNKADMFYWPSHTVKCVV